MTAHKGTDTGHHDWDRMLNELAEASVLRFYTCRQDGMSEKEAFKEILSVILEEYKSRFAS